MAALAFVLTTGMWRALPVASGSPATWAWFPANTARAASAGWTITEQGNRFLRKLLVEAAQTTVRKDEGFRKECQHRCRRRPQGVAKVAAARNWLCDSTGCYVAMSAIRRSLISRATRGCPWAMFSP